MASRNMAKYLKKVVEPPSALTRPRPLFKKRRPARAKPSPEPKWQRVKVGLLARFDAKPGKENELAGYLRAGLTRVQQNPGTASWFALRFGPAKFAIFDVFTDEAECQAHLHGIITATLKGKSAELLARPPVIEKVDVIAAKLADFG